MENSNIPNHEGKKDIICNHNKKKRERKQKYPKPWREKGYLQPTKKWIKINIPNHEGKKDIIFNHVKKARKWKQKYPKPCYLEQCKKIDKKNPDLYTCIEKCKV